MPRSADEPKGAQPPTSKEAARRMITRLTYWSLPFVITLGVLNFFPDIPIPWVIAKVAVEIVFIIVYGVAVISFSSGSETNIGASEAGTPSTPNAFPEIGRQVKPLVNGIYKASVQVCTSVISGRIVVADHSRPSPKWP